MPSSAAALVLLPPVCASVMAISCRSASSTVMPGTSSAGDDWDVGEDGEDGEDGEVDAEGPVRRGSDAATVPPARDAPKPTRSAGVTNWPRATIVARSITLRS